MSEDDEWVVVKPTFKRKPKVDDDGWETITKKRFDMNDTHNDMVNPPPRSIKLKIVYEALLEGRIEWGPEW